MFRVSYDYMNDQTILYVDDGPMLRLNFESLPSSFVENAFHGRGTWWDLLLANMARGRSGGAALARPEE